MRYLLISDIHANLAAFETVLKDAEGLYDKVWCLGDMVGYGPDPNECVELLLTLDHLCIAGNHDWELAETFFNSITRRILATVGVDCKIEFVNTDQVIFLDDFEKFITLIIVAIVVFCGLFTFWSYSSYEYYATGNIWSIAYEYESIKLILANITGTTGTLTVKGIKNGNHNDMINFYEWLEDNLGNRIQLQYYNNLWDDLQIINYTLKGD